MGEGVPLFAHETAALVSAGKAAKPYAARIAAVAGGAAKDRKFAVTRALAPIIANCGPGSGTALSVAEVAEESNRLPAPRGNVPAAC